MAITLQGNIAKIQNRILRTTAAYIAPHAMFATRFTDEAVNIGQEVTAQVVDRSAGTITDATAPGYSFDFFKNASAEGRLHDVKSKMQYIAESGFFLDKIISESGDINETLLQEILTQEARGVAKAFVDDVLSGFNSTNFESMEVEPEDFDRNSVIELADTFNENDVLQGRRYAMVSSRATGNLSRDEVVSSSDYFGQRVEGLSADDKTRMFTNIDTFDAIMENPSFPANAEGTFGAAWHPNACRVITGVPVVHEELKAAIGFRSTSLNQVITQEETGLSMLFRVMEEPKTGRLYFWFGFVYGKEYGGQFGDQDFSKAAIVLKAPATA